MRMSPIQTVCWSSRLGCCIQNSLCIDDTGNDGDDGEQGYESVTMEEEDWCPPGSSRLWYCIQSSLCIDDTSNDGADNGERLYESVRMEEEDWCPPASASCRQMLGAQVTGNYYTHYNTIFNMKQYITIQFSYSTITVKSLIWNCRRHGSQVCSAEASSTAPKMCKDV